jgi:RNA polymerase sigma-70 factor (ECF subfamily)
MLENNTNHERDEEIVKRVKDGDTESFGVLIERYENKIKRYAKKFLSNVEDIADIVQEIFIKAFTNIRGFDTDKKFSSWIYRIAHNELVNVLKRKDKNPLLFFDPDTFFPHPIAKETADKKVRDKEIRKNLDKCLNKLSPKYRETLFLHYIEELDYREIADIMRIPISTVGVRLKRGKKLLKSVCKELSLDY